MTPISSTAVSSVRRPRRAPAVAMICLLLAGGVRASTVTPVQLAQDQEQRSESREAAARARRIEGVWDVMVTIRDCQTGNPHNRSCQKHVHPWRHADGAQRAGESELAQPQFRDMAHGRRWHLRCSVQVLSLQPGRHVLSNVEGHATDPTESGRGRVCGQRIRRSLRRQRRARSNRMRDRSSNAASLTGSSTI